MNSMPSLKLNDRGMWEIRWTENRRSMRESTRTSDAAEAQRKLAAFLVARQMDGAVSPPVAAVLDAYLESLRAKGRPSAERRGYAAANLTAHFTGAVADITDARVEAYGRARYAGRIGRRCTSDGTLRQELSTLASALRCAVKTKALKLADMPSIALPDAPPPKDMWLTETESAQLLAAADSLLATDPTHRGALFAHIALATASRKRAIEELRWQQIDFAARLVRFNPDGRRQTSKRRPVVPISSVLLPVLQLAREAAHGDFVLGNDSDIERSFGALCRVAHRATGNARFLDITPHVLRHTWATQAARAGVSLFEVAGVLGDQLTTVQRVYQHHCPDYLRGAVEFRAR